jgi:hypothetical protein
VFHMEDVLEVYHRRHDPEPRRVSRRQICLSQAAMA